MKTFALSPSSHFEHLIECGQSGARILLFNVNYRRIGQFNNLSRFGFCGLERKREREGDEADKKASLQCDQVKSERENN